MNFTKSQLEAIEKQGTSMIVSAGAGSGKTAVLTERVLYKLRQGVKINELLILTFTKAAASEMRERIRKKMQEENLVDSLALLDTAYIGTFDSFALSILKKYGYLKNIRSDVTISDSSIISIYKKQLLESILEEKYKSKDKDFLDFIKAFCTKNDREVQKWILKLDSKLDMKEDKITFLKDYIETFFSDEKIDENISKYEQLLKESLSSIEHLLDLLNTYAEGDYYTKVSDALLPLLNSDSYEDILNNLNVTIPRIPNNSNEELKTIKNRIKKQLDNLNDLCRYSSKTDMKEELLKTKPILEVIISIIIELTEKLTKWKRDNDFYEFQDVAILSLEILKEFEEVREEVKNSFKEIMVDEYQDTNDLQNHFLDYITDNNLYVVGDIKQSIYRFRNANPKHFKSKYDNYKDKNGGIKIDLNQNFRSRYEVLDDINFIFNQIMDDKVGDATYKVDHQMVFGNQAYNNEGKTNNDQHMQIIRYDYDANIGYSKEELEAYYIALDIEKKIKEKYQVYDFKDKKLRDVTYKDFAILMDRSKQFSLYKKIFEYMGIPISIEKDESIKEETEIVVIKNILGLVIAIFNQTWDKNFEFNFVSVARSFVFDYDDDEIFHILKNHKFFDTELFKKASSIAKKIEYLTPKEVTCEIIEEFNIYSNLITLGDVTSRIIRIESLLEMADNIASLGYDVLKFKNHLDEVMTSDLDLKVVAPHSSSDAVIITTIHKSKGLEYPICYFSELYKKFNIDDLKDKFLYDNEYGFSATYFDEGFEQTIIKPLLQKKYIQEEISERMRLFYVALTRAKEKMIFITSFKNQMEEARDSEGVIDLQVRLEYRSFLDMLSSVQDTLEPYFEYYTFSKNDVLDNYKLVKQKDLPIFEEDIKEYKLENLIIETKEQEQKHFSKTLNKVVTKEESKNLKFGEYIHKCLEEIDFKKPDSYYDKMDIFTKSKIKHFLNQPLLANVTNANVLKEYEFTYKVEDTLYRGIIDLMLEYQNHIDIIDYKLSGIEDEHYYEQLKGYKGYISSKSDKPVNIYLYSILQDSIKKID